jgi:beta-phosphoglucomutase-like phosphatase (HAD superfamily)
MSVRFVLCDADGNLFPSEAPAFVASADVTNRFLASLGVEVRYGAEQLRLATTGKNFRTTAVDLAVAHGVRVDASLTPSPGVVPAGSTGTTLTAEVLDRWLAEEKDVVSDHLSRVLRPDPAVLEPLTRLAAQHELALVSSSALTRVDACLRATGLAGLFPAERRFSAEDSLPRPTSKPDPAVYLHALDRLGVAAEDSLAVEDSLPGARSAVAAGVPTLGNLVFVPPDEREGRRAELTDAGVVAVVSSWSAVEAALAVPEPAAR